MSRIDEDEKIDCDFYEHARSIEDLPCGGCNYCRRIRDQWGHFFDDVDDTVDLGEPGPMQKQMRVRKFSKIDTEEDNPASLYVWVEKKPIPVRRNQIDPSQTGNMIEEQQRDPKLSLLYNWIEKGENLPPAEFSLADSETKFLWLNRSLFEVTNGIITFVKDKEKEPRTVVPNSLRTNILELNHDIPIAGHLGGEKTYEKVKKSFYWYGMKNEIDLYVKGCSKCTQNKKYGKTSRHPLQINQAGVPLERVHIDFLGPLPISKQGNTCVLVISDSFTKWLELVALPDQTAEETAKALVNQFIARLGCPLAILTDQGTNFEADLFQALCAMLKIKKLRTTPYRPQANGQAERANRTFMQAVRCFVGKHKNEWDEYLPQIAAAIRSAVNEQTGQTPNKMMLGREVTSPAELIFSGAPAAKTTYEFLIELEKSIKEAHELARESLKTKTRYMKKNYDRFVCETQFEIGDPVYILNKSVKKGTSKKLNPHSGPRSIYFVKY